MTKFVCYGCKKTKMRVGGITDAYKDSPVAFGFCETESLGKNPTPTGCVYPNAARNKRFKWVRE